MLACLYLLLRAGTWEALARENLKLRITDAEFAGALEGTHSKELEQVAHFDDCCVFTYAVFLFACCGTKQMSRWILLNVPLHAALGAPYFKKERAKIGFILKYLKVERSLSPLRCWSSDLMLDALKKLMLKIATDRGICASNAWILTLTFLAKVSCALYCMEYSGSSVAKLLAKRLASSKRKPRDDAKRLQLQSRDPGLPDWLFFHARVAACVTKLVETFDAEIAKARKLKKIIGPETKFRAMRSYDKLRAISLKIKQCLAILLHDTTPYTRLSDLRLIRLDQMELEPVRKTFLVKFAGTTTGDDGDGSADIDIHAASENDKVSMRRPLEHRRFGGACTPAVSVALYAAMEHFVSWSRPYTGPTARSQYEQCISSLLASLTPAAAAAARRASSCSSSRQQRKCAQPSNGDGSWQPPRTQRSVDRFPQLQVRRSQQHLFLLDKHGSAARANGPISAGTWSKFVGKAYRDHWQPALQRPELKDLRAQLSAAGYSTPLPNSRRAWARRTQAK